jgi:hypothetical protein
MSDNSDSAAKILISFGLDDKQANEAVDRIKKFGKETEESGEKAKHANEHHREMHHLFGELNRVVPGLGEAMHAAFAGPLGPLILLGMAIGEVSKAFKDYNSELDKIPAAEIAAHAEAIKSVRAAWDSAQDGIGKYYGALRTAGDDKDPIAKALANIQKVEDAQIESSKKITAALGTQEVAFLRAHGASPEQVAAAEQRNAVREGRLDSEKEYGAGVGGLQREQQARQAADARLVADANAAMAEAAATKRRAETDKTELEHLRTGGEGGVSPAQAKLDKLRKLEESFDSVSAHKFTPSDILAVDTFTGFAANAGRKGTGREVLNEDIASAQAEVEIEKKRVAQLEKSEARRAQEQAEAETRAQEAQARSVTNRARLRELPGEIKQAGTIQSTSDNGRAIVDRINAYDTATGQTLGEMGAAANLNQSQIIEIAKRLINGQMSHAQEIAGLKAAMALAEQRNAALHQQTMGNRF